MNKEALESIKKEIVKLAEKITLLEEESPPPEYQAPEPKPIHEERIIDYNTYRLWDQYVTINMKKAHRHPGEDGSIDVESNTFSGRLLARWTGETGYISEGRCKGRLLEDLATW